MTKEDLKEDQQNVYSEKTCPYCRRTFNVPSHLRAHLSYKNKCTQNTGRITPYCTDCGRTYSSIYGFKRHKCRGAAQMLRRAHRDMVRMYSVAVRVAAE